MNSIPRWKSATRWADNRNGARTNALAAASVVVFCLAALAQSDPGTYDEATRLYRNHAYAFSCKVPAGWVLRTEQLKPDGAAENGAAENQVLLAAFERPPEATSPTPVATMVIASESLSSYPGLKTVEDYFSPLTEVVTAKGFHAVNDPYPFPLGTTKVVRQDFSHEQKDRPTTYQSTLVILSHGSIVSFTFLAASEEDVDDLIENLSFAPGNTTKPTPKSTPKTAPQKKSATPQKAPS